jgi:hypothetical protein
MLLAGFIFKSSNQKAVVKNFFAGNAEMTVSIFNFYMD